MVKFMSIDPLSLWENYGVKGLILGIIMFISSALIKTNSFSNFWIGLYNRLYNKIRNKKNSITESNILNHDIFSYIDYWRFSRVPTLEFSSEYRTQVFRKYLSLYLEAYKNEITTFVTEGTYKDMDDSNLWKTSLALINKIVFQYEKAAENANIPTIIINKMKLKNNDSIQLTIDLIEGITTSQFYEGDQNYLKVYSILNIILSVLESTILNSRDVCNMINGELKNSIYTNNGKDYIEP